MPGDRILSPEVCTASAASLALNGHFGANRVTLSLGSGLLVAVVVARVVLPPAVRLLAKHASTELYQLTLISFCLCASWLSGYMVCPLPSSLLELSIAAPLQYDYKQRTHGSIKQV